MSTTVSGNGFVSNVMLFIKHNMTLETLDMFDPVKSILPLHMRCKQLKGASRPGKLKVFDTKGKLYIATIQHQLTED